MCQTLCKNLETLDIDWEKDWEDFKKRWKIFDQRQKDWIKIVIKEEEKCI